jgi:hypothetical protein
MVVGYRYQDMAVPPYSQIHDAVHKAQTGGFMWTNVLTNSVALVRERTIPTEQPPFVGEVSANFYG